MAHELGPLSFILLSAILCVSLTRGWLVRRGVVTELARQNADLADALRDAHRRNADLERLLRLKVTPMPKDQPTPQDALTWPTS